MCRDVEHPMNSLNELVMRVEHEQLITETNAYIAPENVQN